LTAGGTSVAATKTAATTGGSSTGPKPGPFQILFSGNSTALTAAAKRTLVAFAQKLSAGADVTMTGYAKGNAFLAKSRATTVALFLEAAVSNMRFQLHEVTTSSANSVFVVTVSGWM
jgi:outer membrane protein OmpA-like peptidoglycan-associated protein